MSRKIEYVITDNYDGKKVLDYLKYEKNYSHRLITKLKQETDGITLNGEHIKTVDIIKSGDRLCVTIPDDESTSISVLTQMPLDILYEDDDIIVVNKPAMLSVHETHNHLGDTLSNALAFYLTQRGKPSAFRAVGRLDKGTSGIVVCALNKYAAAKLSGKVYKEYLAIATGVLIGDGIIDKPIYRPDPIKTLRAVDERGERAVTYWKAVRNDGVNTLLHIHLETGRTHQIRVHFASCGTALVGDTMYGKPDGRITHQALHCAYCRFIHPVSDKAVECFAPVPNDMNSIIDCNIDFFNKI